MQIKKLMFPNIFRMIVGGFVNHVNDMINPKELRDYQDILQ